MKVLIVENEIYLAQSMASKLADFGYSCEIATNAKDALRDDKFDVILLSTGLIGQDFYPVIKKHQSSIIILLISYISSDTVSNPIKAGADDYIQKPFMIEELVRKIKLFESYKRYEILNTTYEQVITSYLKSYKLPKCDFKKVKIPLLIVAKRKQYADSFVFFYAKWINLAYKQISALDEELITSLKSYRSHSLLYITEFDKIEESEREEVLKLIKDKSAILATETDLDISGFDKMVINIDSNGFDGSDILTIDEYVKHIIFGYQDTFPDTELSKRLGISRKSLWEKRKKYDITKKK
ncbi:response regulator [Campylobacter hyointestinalis]|uniref:response regulator n=2 Tax=Campylobacter hyointestinalis TaxID=198 RepID=UPI0039C833D4